MWAGGRVIFRRPLVLGTEIRRVSTIESITEKHGRSGKLVFVTVRHDIFGDDGLAIEEEQDLVYREPADTSGAPDDPASNAADAEIAGVAGIDADPVLLFRYSALTMNSHRIHYDRRYAMAEEGYPDLVVQGPLQATLLADLAVRRLERPLTTFRFRGLAPAFAGDRLMLHVGEGEGDMQLWASQRGVRTMTATAGC